MALVVIGGALAIVQPGDLGDGEDAAPAVTTTTTTTTTTTVPDDPAVADPADPDATTTTGPTTGIDANGPGRVRDGEIADTGGEAMLALGLVLLGAGLVARRVT